MRTKAKMKQKRSFRLKYAVCLCVLCVFGMVLSGCVDQHPEEKTAGQGTETQKAETQDEEMETTQTGEKKGTQTGESEGTQTGESEGTQTEESGESAESLLEITDPAEKAAVKAAREKVAAMDEEPRIIATSPATAEICDKLDLDLVGVCSSSVSSIPERYADLPDIGTAMSPDMEITASLNPDWILSPASLQSDLQPKYEAIDTDWAFLNLRSVQGMYRSIQELAGGENVYAGTDQEFLTVNTEDMKTKEPDIILRAAHALPDQVVEMFKEDFETNDIWQHFEAVQTGRVYDLSYELFGMSATFRYPEALEELQPLLYPEKAEDASVISDKEKSSEEKVNQKEAEKTEGTPEEKEDGK